MKILLATHYLNIVGGTETYTYALGKELRNRGHEVHFYAVEVGLNAWRYEEIGPIYQNPQDDYDLILMNHNTTLTALQSLKGYGIFTSHGIYPDLEQPAPGADCYVAVSEEVQQHMKEAGYKAHIIRNGIDLKRFRSNRPVSNELERVLCMTQGTQATQKVKKACEQLNIEFISVSKSENIWHIEAMIEWADLIIGVGRSAYDAMAMGRDVLLYDERSYSIRSGIDGFVSAPQIEHLITHNCSGRKYALEATEDRLRYNLEDYSPIRAHLNRNIAKIYFNIEKSVDSYLKLYEEAK